MRIVLALSKKQRNELRLKFGGKCAYCGVNLPGKGWHADHVEPINRIMRYGTDPKTGYGKLFDTGEMHYPGRDVLGNMFPSCRACNIHKGSCSLEVWRKDLEDITGILQRGYPTYRHAVRFGQVLEHSRPLVFWFEKYVTEEKK